MLLVEVGYLEVGLPDAEGVLLLLLGAAPEAVADAADDDDDAQSPHARQNDDHGPGNWKMKKNDIF